jgi:sugar PTS system EIIA component
MSNVIELSLPFDGIVLPITGVNDYLFNKKIMGEGVAIDPKSSVLYSPVDGEIVLIYDTKHALAIKTVEGLQILIHIGLGTVRLEGKGFACYVKVGDLVKKGDKLMYFDLEYLEMNTSPITPIVITNSELVENFEINYKAKKTGDTLLSITLK